MNEVNQFDKLPKDVIVFMALNYDLVAITAFCQTNSRFNQLVCQNNNFWLQKLQKDFGLGQDNINNHRNNAKLTNPLTNPTPRTYYLYIDRMMENEPNILYFLALSMGDLTLVKMALDRGADIQYTQMGINMFDIDLPLIIAYKNEYYDIANYLLEQNIIDSRINAIKIIGGHNRLIESLPSESDKKKRLLKSSFGEVLPRVIVYLKDEKRLWATIADKLQEFQNDPRIDIDDIYQRRYQQYLNLSK